MKSGESPKLDLFGAAKPADNVASLPLASVFDGYLASYASGVGHTARAKRLDAEKFLTFLKKYRRTVSIEALEVRHWDPSATQHFVDDSLQKGEAPATAARRLATLKHVGRVLAERIPGFINPAREVKAPKLQALRPKSVAHT
jgi:site-specific recombinase XerC